MFRYDVSNFLLQKYFPNESHYLEIGVNMPSLCFDRVKATHKTGVDPVQTHEATKIKYVMTSNDFFEKLEAGETEFPKDKKWDVIYIDGLHLAKQVYLDAVNALNHISENGFVVFHDCHPREFINAHSDYEFFKKRPSEWNGSTWKAFYFLKTELNKKMYTIDTDYGIGVIENNSTGTPIEHTNKFFDFGDFKANVKNDIGLIPVNEFLAMHK